MPKWMMIIATRLVMSIALLVTALAPASASAQDETRFSSLEIDIWPEYDRPTVLVIYRITLAPEVSLPVNLTLRIPAEAGDPAAVAWKEAGEGGGLFNMDYERQVNGDWGLITFTTTMPELQIEYYDPRLLMQDATRHFEFYWPGDFAVDALSVQVQQPRGATEMRISPAMGDGITGQDGLVYYTSQAGSLPADGTFSLTLDYNKASDALSVEGLSVQPSAPVTETTSGRRSLMAALPWALGALGVILIVGGGFWYWQSGKGRQESMPRRRRRAAEELEENTLPVNHIYCHQCGKRAAPNDRFCRACGTRLRKE